jgi:hypothetical protein
MVRRYAVAALLASSAIGTMAAPALADYPGPTTPPATVSASVVGAGQAVVVTAGGFQAGSTVTVNDNGIAVGTAIVQSNTNFTLNVIIANCGTNTLTATGPGGVIASVVVTGVCAGSSVPGSQSSVASASNGGSPVGLASTGSPSVLGSNIPQHCGAGIGRRLSWGP